MNLSFWTRKPKGYSADELQTRTLISWRQIMNLDGTASSYETYLAFRLFEILFVIITVKFFMLWCYVCEIKKWIGKIVYDENEILFVKFWYPDTLLSLWKKCFIVNVVILKNWRFWVQVSLHIIFSIAVFVDLFKILLNCNYNDF